MPAAQVVQLVSVEASPDLVSWPAEQMTEVNARQLAVPGMVPDLKVPSPHAVHVPSLASSPALKTPTTQPDFSKSTRLQKRSAEKIMVVWVGAWAFVRELFSGRAGNGLVIRASSCIVGR